MLGVRLICVGRLKERHYIAACAEYIKRLGPLCRLEVVEIAEDAGRPDALERQGARVLEALWPGSRVAALCIEGTPLSSAAAAERLAALTQSGTSRLCLILGGSLGLSDAVKQAAHERLSMSAMTFPHHLARVMVLEQLYRALSINSGLKYHK